MLNLTPAEILGSFLNKDIQQLNVLYNLIKNISFDNRPPFNLFKDIFIHCVNIHRKWSVDLLKFHLGDLVEKFESYIQLLEIAENNVDIEYVKENIYTYSIHSLLEELNSTIFTNTTYQMEEIIKKYASQLLHLSLIKNQQTPIYTASEIIKLTDDISIKTFSLKLGFDHVLDGGIRNGELLLYIAATAGGKSTFLLRDALTASMQGYKTLYISLELNEELIAKRLKRLMQTFNLTTMPSHLYIKRFPTKGATLDDIFLVADNLSIDIIVLDYLDLLNYKISQNNWLDLESLTAYFRGYANERNMIALTASQTNRGGISNDGKIINLDSVAYSIGKTYTADYIITLTRMDKNQDTSSPTSAANIVAFLAKNRRGPTWMQPLKVDFDTMEITPIFIT